MADNPPQNREQRRAAKYGRHRVDAAAAHDPWPDSQPNPALGDAAAAAPDADHADAPAAVTEPEGKAPDKTKAPAKTKPEPKPKG